MTNKPNNKVEERCKAYTQATGPYSSFHSGEQCKRKAKIDGYCKQHFEALKNNQPLNTMEKLRDELEVLVEKMFKDRFVTDTNLFKWGGKKAFINHIAEFFVQKIDLAHNSALQAALEAGPKDNPMGNGDAADYDLYVFGEATGFNQSNQQWREAITKLMEER